MKSESDLHSMLHYVISRAALEGKVGTSVAHVDLTSLTDYEGPQFVEEAMNTMLKVTVTTEWTHADDVEDLFMSDFEEKDPEGEEETDEPSSGREGEQ